MSKLAELKEKNKALKEQLAKLEKLAASVDNKDSKAKTSQKLKDVNAIKAAFDHFDADGSGFIDKAEFAALSADLGELLDDAELTAAVKEIDVSGDGKISFNEFIRWWTTDKKTSDKSAAKVAVLKAKLKAKEYAAVPAALIRQLSTLKADDSEFVKHRIAVNVGDFKEVKSSINAAVSFGKIAEAKYLNAPSVGHVTLALNSTATEATVETERKKLDTLLGSAGMPFKTEVDMKSRTMNVWVAAPEDPFALAAQLGLDLRTFIKELSVKLELPFSPLDLVDTSSATPLAELIGIHFETKLEFRKALVHSLASMLPGAQDAAALAFLEHFNLSLSLGSVRDYLNGLLPPEGTNVAAAQHQVPPQLWMMAQGAAWVLKDGSKQKLATKYADLWQHVGGEAKLVELVNSARSVLDQPVQVAYHTQSGVNVTIDLKNIFPVAAIPSNALTGAAAGSVVAKKP